MLFCGSFESCVSSIKFSDFNYIGSGSIFAILIPWMYEPIPQIQFNTFFSNFSKMETFYFDKYMQKRTNDMFSFSWIYFFFSEFETGNFFKAKKS